MYLSHEWSGEQCEICEQTCVVFIMYTILFKIKISDNDEYPNISTYTLYATEMGEYTIELSERAHMTCIWISNERIENRP